MLGSHRIKDVDALTVADLKAFPVWEFVNDDEKGEMAVRPVRTPVSNLDGRLVGLQVRLANDAEVWALIGNVETNDPRQTEHFLTLSVFRDGQSFTLARYHDIGAERSGPQALADFLGLPIDKVFPISYDLGRFSKGDPAALTGRIEKEPRERLTRAELIKLAVPRTKP
jgi:hypothetical protein